MHVSCVAHPLFPSTPPSCATKTPTATVIARDASFCYLGDAHFNVTTLVDTAGDAIERYVYSPYGVITTYDAIWSNIRSSSTYDNKYTYTGRQLDKETGIYQYRHRVYCAALGRFCGRDPLGYTDCINLVEYVWDSPVGRIDPLGLQVVPLHPGGVGYIWEPALTPKPVSGRFVKQCGTGVPGIPLDQNFYEPQRETDNLGAWMQVEVYSTDLCDRKSGAIRIDLTFRWIRYARGITRNRRYHVWVDGTEIEISEGNDTRQITPVDPPADWPWPAPIGKIEVNGWYAWTASFTKRSAACPKTGDGSLEIKVEADYTAPDHHEMVETATVKWSYGCSGDCSNCRTTTPFKCDVHETTPANQTD